MSTLLNPDISVDGLPVASCHGVMDVAALRINFAPVGSRRNSCRKERKFVKSFGLMALHPIPWFPGYSQLTRTVARSVNSEEICED